MAQADGKVLVGGEFDSIGGQPRNDIARINADGSLYEGFPLEGSTRFSIGYFKSSDSRFNLIVGSENNFLYNYSIE